MAAKKQKINPGTKIVFVAGVNDERIGGNCSIIEHTNEKGEVSRAMFDLGTMFAPYESGFDAAYPNVDEYFDRVDPVSGKETKATKPVDMLFITHAHEDHIGGLVNYVRMGYKLPPIRTSRFTRNLINIVFTQNGITEGRPEIVPVKPGENIRVSEDMVAEAFSVSHSIIDSLGFHTLTFVDGKPEAGIMNYGDFLTEENMPLGKSFNSEEIEDLMRRKPVTTFLVDSTSISPRAGKRIGFDKAVENAVSVINRNPERNVIISPVISRSLQNMSIDIEAARQTGTKVCLDGTWLRLVYKAMQLSGYKDFEDVVYKGDVAKFLEDKKVAKKYIICTGAFAQGLNEYKSNQSGNGFNAIPMASATRMALGLHKSLTLGSNCLVLARQRIIDEINGKTGPEMLQLMAAQGAKVVMTPGSKKVGNFEEIQMQDSGHVNGEAFVRLMEMNRKYAPDAVYVPIHGNPQQCETTRKMAEDFGAKSVTVANSAQLAVKAGEAKEIEDAGRKDFSWIAVKKVLYNPLEPEEFVLPEGSLEFWLVDKNYQPLQDKPFFDTAMVRNSKPGNDDYYANHGELFDDTTEFAAKETMRERKAKLSRKEKKRLSDEERKSRAEEKADRRKRLANKRRNADTVQAMTYIDGQGIERVKTTKSGKIRKVNPLRLRGKGKELD